MRLSRDPVGSCPARSHRSGSNFGGLAFTGSVPVLHMTVPMPAHAVLTTLTSEAIDAVCAALYEAKWFDMMEA